MARKSAEGRVLLDVGRDHVAVVTLNRPESLNSLDTEAAEGLQERLEELTARDDIHVVILTGAGRGFCSGADLRWLSMLAHSGFDGADDARPEPTCSYHRRAPALTIAAVNGPAAGAGWGLAMACDIRIASPAAKFVATFSRMGLGPDYGLAQTLPLAVGRDRALELLLTARVIDAQEAQRIGAVTSIAQDALSEARRLASAVAQVPGRAIRSTKRSLRLAAEADLDTVVDDIEARAQAELLNHPRFAEDARRGSADSQPSAGISGLTGRGPCGAGVRPGPAVLAQIAVPLDDLHLAAVHQSGAAGGHPYFADRLRDLGTTLHCGQDLCVEPVDLDAQVLDVGEFFGGHVLVLPCGCCALIPLISIRTGASH